MSLARAKQRRAASPLGRVFGTGVTCNGFSIHRAAQGYSLPSAARGSRKGAEVRRSPSSALWSFEKKIRAGRAETLKKKNM